MRIDDEINSLSTKLLEIASIAEENLKRSTNYYKNIEDKPNIDDDIVDRMEREIEESCLEIMLRERPFAKDMRELSGILTLVSDIERLGDHAEDIEELTDKIKACEIYEFKSVYKMLDEALKMVHNAILSFINKDESLATTVINSDDLIDKMFEEEISNLINLDSSHKISSKLAILTTLVVKYIERIADHAVNIAEWVIYLIRGFYKDKQIF